MVSPPDMVNVQDGATLGDAPAPVESLELASLRNRVAALEADVEWLQQRSGLRILHRTGSN